jgi:hypothetical protein
MLTASQSFYMEVKFSKLRASAGCAVQLPSSSDLFVTAIHLQYQEKCAQLVCYVLFYKYIISQKLVSQIYWHT